jgi:hypothetical protein
MKNKKDSSNFHNKREWVSSFLLGMHIFYSPVFISYGIHIVSISEINLDKLRFSAFISFCMAATLTLSSNLFISQIPAGLCVRAPRANTQVSTYVQQFNLSRHVLGEVALFLGEKKLHGGREEIWIQLADIVGPRYQSHHQRDDRHCHEADHRQVEVRDSEHPEGLLDGAKILLAF